MARNADYTQEYFSILSDLGGDIEGRRRARSYMSSSTAICHHQVVESTFIPRLYNAQTRQTMEYLATTAHRILCKVIDRYLHHPEYRSIFNFDPRLEELILLPRGYDALLPFARVDVFLNENDYSAAFCEFNADGSSGMNEDREITNSLKTSKTFQEFSNRHQLASSELFSTWVSEFIDIYATYKNRVENPCVAICDFLENAVIDEFKIFVDEFARHGIENCIICDVRELTFDGEVLRNKDEIAINAIWRRSVTNDIIEHWDESQAYIDAVRAEKVALIGSFAGHIVHDKQIFRVLFMPETQTFLSEDENEFIADTVPFTAFLEDEYVDLSVVKASKDEWIIKPTDHYGADQVYAGVAFDQKEWDEKIDSLANQATGVRFIAQKYITPFQTLTLRPDDTIETLADSDVLCEPVPYNNLQGLYVYNGKFKGVFSRLGPLPTISKDMQGITAATIWVDCSHE